MVGLNIKAKIITEGLNTMSYRIDCKECGHSGFASVAKGKIPTCPKCSKSNGADMKEVLENTIGVNGHSETHHNMILSDENELELIHPVKLSQQVELLNATGVGKLDSIYRVFSGEEKPPATEEELAEKRKELDKIVGKANQVGASKRVGGSAKKKATITDADLDYIMQKIEVSFGLNEKFKNKDLAPLVEEKFSARQTPSRLKRMVDAGMLESDSSSPKNYWRVN